MHIICMKNKNKYIPGAVRYLKNRFAQHPNMSVASMLTDATKVTPLELRISEAYGHNTTPNEELKVNTNTIVRTLTMNIFSLSDAQNSNPSNPHMIISPTNRMLFRPKDFEMGIATPAAITATIPVQKVPTRAVSSASWPD